MAKSKQELAVKKSTAMSTGNWADTMAQFAQSAAETTKGAGGGGQWLSLKNGEFHFGEDVLGESIQVVILDTMHDHAYYPDVYDEDKPQSPACFAIAHVEEDLVPHEDAENPQAESCAECEWNEFGTDMRGKGKACRNKYRLAVIAANEDGDINEEAEIAFLSLPPTSMKHYSSYVRKLAKVKNIPPMAVVTELTIENNPRGSGFIVKPTMVSDIKDPAEQQAVLALHERLGDDLAQPYAKVEEEARPTRRQSKKKTAKKKVAKKAATKKTAKKKARRKF